MANKVTAAWEKMEGLIPAIVQDVGSAQVLMVAYMNEAAYQQTIDSGKVTFFSRSKQALWTKGETSGNTLALDSIHLDCDGDAFLVLARPAGPTCHLGTRSCFGERTGMQFLYQLEDIIKDRSGEPADKSYTASLLASGIRRVAQKVGEEGVETALAGVCQSDEELINESADLLYHLLVLARARKVPLSSIVDQLAQRHQRKNAAE